MSARVRCSEDSERRGEPLAGTASTVRAFLLVECPGPWGVNAVTENRLPRSVTRELLRRAHAAGVRVLMIRRHGRTAADQMTVFAGFAGAHDPWLETTCLDSPEELLEIDLESIGRGSSPRLTPHGEPLFLVCTHGRHDVCCAERGRPVARALTDLLPAEAWEVSHIGGDRFAGNMLVLPEGLYYGRIEPDEAVQIAQTHRSGRLDLTHLRGRCAYPFPVQFAEVHLRQQLGDTAIGSLRVTDRETRRNATTAVFSNGSQSWRVEVRSQPSTPEQLTCRATRLGVGHVFEVVSITSGPPTA